jgi:hypothetical protein
MSQSTKQEGRLAAMGCLPHGCDEFQLHSFTQKSALPGLRGDSSLMIVLGSTGGQAD